MAGLVPFNRRANLAHSGTGFEDFYNMLDDFFTGPLASNRNLLRDTFKIDIVENDTEYLVEAEVPGFSKDEIGLSIENDMLCIQVNRTEEADKSGVNYIHRERRASSMNRRVRLTGASLDKIKAKLEDGMLAITIPKEVKGSDTRKIDIE